MRLVPSEDGFRDVERPPGWLGGRDRMTVETERIGALTNTERVVAPRGGSR